MAMHKEALYKQSIAEVLQSSSDNIFLYWKGRVALYAILKAMEVAGEDEIILPGFTCVVVANAIKYLGAKPVYVDIDRKTLNPGLAQYKNAVTPKTKVIIVQNTFGLSSQVDEIAKWAKENSIYAIEDCAHGFGGTYNDKPNGIYCDAAFYSTQWNKPFSTGIGGFTVINNPELLSKMVCINNTLVAPGFVEKCILRSLLFFKDTLINPYTYWQLLKLYRWLSRNNLIIGSSSGGEITGIDMPVNYFKSISSIQIKRGIKNISRNKEMISLRKSNALIYTDFLRKNGKYYVDESLHPDHCFLRYPFLVKDKDLFLSKSAEANIEIGDWFCSPLHPVESGLEKWEVDEAQIPVACDISKHILNLPTSTKKPDKIIAFLQANSELIV
ncbi:MAG: DegT/DnrJ/EryC1/StrS family aminotransferase [Bacteroidetes bacterium]|nr:DegT/DnrJ/EryC1/StrS family aminotransferase [Bacteroidota bacterium]